MSLHRKLQRSRNVSLQKFARKDSTGDIHGDDSARLTTRRGSTLYPIEWNSSTSRAIPAIATEKFRGGRLFGFPITSANEWHKRREIKSEKSEKYSLELFWCNRPETHTSYDAKHRIRSPMEDRVNCWFHWKTTGAKKEQKPSATSLYSTSREYGQNCFDCSQVEIHFCGTLGGSVQKTNNSLRQRKGGSVPLHSSLHAMHPFHKEFLCTKKDKVRQGQVGGDESEIWLESRRIKDFAKLGSRSAHL
jgi:hypothetical protein